MREVRDPTKLRSRSSTTISLPRQITRLLLALLLLEGPLLSTSSHAQAQFYLLLHLIDFISVSCCGFSVVIKVSLIGLFIIIFCEKVSFVFVVDLEIFGLQEDVIARFVLAQRAKFVESYDGLEDLIDEGVLERIMRQ